MYMVSQIYLCSYYFAFAKMRRDIVSEYMKQMRYIVLLLQVCPITHSHSGLYWLTKYPERENCLTKTELHFLLGCIRKWILSSDSFNDFFFKSVNR